MHISSNSAVFDRDLIARRRMRAKTTFHEHDFLFRWCKEQLSERLLDINRIFPNVLQLGSRGSFSCGEHSKLGDRVVTCDISRVPVENTFHNYIQCSEEFLPIAPHSMDLAISNLNLHSVNDLPGAFLQIRKALKKDGLFLGAIPGGETLYELRDAMATVEKELSGTPTARVFPFVDKQQMGELLMRSGFSLPVVDSDTITVTYDNVFKLMADLRGMGESNSILGRDKKPLGKDFFMHLAQCYLDRYSEGAGRIKASFEIIFLFGWAPHKSQQKPLPPGSAKHSLADALETKEINMGE